jgi:hypothetical protein
MSLLQVIDGSGLKEEPPHTLDFLYATVESLQRQTAVLRKD